MRRIESFEELIVWQRAMDLMERSYAVTHLLPPHERWAMSSQLQRASLSVACNIAEGNGRTHRREYIHHLSIARGSLNETRTLLLAAERLGYVDRATLQPMLGMAAILARQLLTLMRALDPNRRPTDS